VLTTENNQTQHTLETQNIQKKLPWLTKQATPWFGMPFMTSGHKTVQALFLQPQGPHRDANGLTCDIQATVTKTKQ